MANGIRALLAVPLIHQGKSIGVLVLRRGRVGPFGDKTLRLLEALRNWGMEGKSEAEVIERAASEAPSLLAAASSASAMWTANACTMTPSIDSADERAHFTPANLGAKLHRSIEPDFTCRILRSIFPDEERFRIHSPLHGGESMSDEGAANHSRLCPDPQSPGLHVFVYGRSSLNPDRDALTRFPARQTRESFEAIVRRHKIPANQVIFLQQSPKAIDAGVFHNDVIAVGNRNVYLFHEDAYVDPDTAIRDLEQAYQSLTGEALCPILVRRDQVSLELAVQSYLFNSQLLEREDGGMLLVVPSECTDSKPVSEFLDSLIADRDNPICELLVFDLKESMYNGGGPACLRNRITLNNSEIRHIRGRVLLDDSLYEDLVAWVRRHYRDTLSPEDLADPLLMKESRAALAELGSILHLPDLYAESP